MKFVVIGTGTRGDIFPLISLAGGLVARGHSVTLAASPVYEKVARWAGINTFILSIDDEMHRRSIASQHILASRYSPLFFTRYACNWNLSMYEVLQAEAIHDPIVLSSASGLLWADFTAHKRLGLRVIRLQVDLPQVALAPTIRPTLPETNVQARLVWNCARTWSQMASRNGVASGITSFQRTQARKNSLPHIGLFPEWLIGGKLRTTNLSQAAGFLPNPWTAEPECEKIGETDRLLVFVSGTEGTCQTWMDRFTSASLGICNELGRSGILLGGVRPRQSLSGTRLQWTEFRPLTSILGRADAIIHHGGIGTAAEAIRHEVPQIIIPRVFSQHSNAVWLFRAGIAEVIGPDEYCARTGARIVASVLEDSVIRTRIRECAGISDPDLDLAKLCRALEGLER